MCELDGGQKADKAFGWIIVDEVKDVVVRSRVGASGVDQGCLGVAENDRVVPKHDFHGAFQKRRRPVVVRGGPLQEWRRRQRRDTVEVARIPYVHIVARIANSPIEACVVLADARRIVGRSIVGNDEFEVAVCLIEEGLDRLRDKSSRVEDRETNGYKRH